MIAYGLHRRTGSLWPEARVFHYRTRNGAERKIVVFLGRRAQRIDDVECLPLRKFLESLP